MPVVNMVYPVPPPKVPYFNSNILAIHVEVIPKPL